MDAQPKTKASSLSFAELGPLWKEPPEEAGAKPGTVG